MRLEEAIRILGDVLKVQKLTLAEHTVVQEAFKTLVEATKNGDNGVPVLHPVQQGE